MWNTSYAVLLFVFINIVLVVWCGTPLQRPPHDLTTVPLINNNNKRPLTPKSMPPAGDEQAKLKT